MSERLLMLLTETPLHAGSGSELGAVDLPIQRERHTELPTVFGSGVKGVLRAALRQDQNRAVVEALCGPDPRAQARADAGEGAGESTAGEGAGESTAAAEPALTASALAVGDARLLLFPVRTVGPAFAWVTAPFCLARLKRDLHRTDAALAQKLTIPDVVPGEALVTKEFPSQSASGVAKVILEDYELTAQPLPKPHSSLPGALVDLLPGTDPALDYWRNLLPEALVIVSDDLLRDFTRHATEVVTRVRLDPDEKTVVKGNLWTEEYLPADTLLYSVLRLNEPRAEKHLANATNANATNANATNANTTNANTTNANAWSPLYELPPVLQVGGKETVGRGFVRSGLHPAPPRQQRKEKEVTP